MQDNKRLEEVKERLERIRFQRAETRAWTRLVKYAFLWGFLSGLGLGIVIGVAIIVW